MILGKSSSHRKSINYLNFNENYNFEYSKPQGFDLFKTADTLSTFSSLSTIRTIKPQKDESRTSIGADTISTSASLSDIHKSLDLKKSEENLLKNKTLLKLDEFRDLIKREYEKTKNIELLLQNEDFKKRYLLIVNSNLDLKKSFKNEKASSPRTQKNLSPRKPIKPEIDQNKNNNNNFKKPETKNEKVINKKEKKPTLNQSKPVSQKEKNNREPIIKKMNSKNEFRKKEKDVSKKSSIIINRLKSIYLDSSNSDQFNKWNKKRTIRAANFNNNNKKQPGDQKNKNEKDEPAKLKSVRKSRKLSSLNIKNSQETKKILLTKPKVFEKKLFSKNSKSFRELAKNESKNCLMKLVLKPKQLKVDISLKSQASKSNLLNNNKNDKTESIETLKDEIDDVKEFINDTETFSKTTEAFNEPSIKNEEASNTINQNNDTFTNLTSTEAFKNSNNGTTADNLSPLQPDEHELSNHSEKNSIKDLSKKPIETEISQKELNCTEADKNNENKIDVNSEQKNENNEYLNLNNGSSRENLNDGFFLEYAESYKMKEEYYKLETIDSESSLNTIYNNKSISNSYLNSKNKKIKEIIAESEVSTEISRKSNTNLLYNQNLVKFEQEIENRKLCENKVNDAFKNIFDFHKDVLKKYFKSNENDKHLARLIEESEEEDQKWRIFICLPSLFDKHEKKLISVLRTPNNTIPNLIPSNIDKRIVGEVVYQLEQRIFHFIFNIEPINRRFIGNGYEPLNIRDTIVNFSIFKDPNVIDRVQCLLDCERLQKYSQNYEYLMKSLYDIGYEEHNYQNISSFLIMKYGLFPCIPIDYKVYIENCDHLELFFQMLIKVIDDSERDYLIVLYTCLILMALEDGKPLFRWQ